MRTHFLYFLVLGIPAFLFFYWGTRQIKKQIFTGKSLFLRKFVRGLPVFVEIGATLFLVISFCLIVYRPNLGIPFFVFGFVGAFLVLRFFFQKFYLETLFQSLFFLRSLEQLLSVGNSYPRCLFLLSQRPQCFIIRKVLRNGKGENTFCRDKVFSFLFFLFSSLHEASNKGFSVRKTVSVYSEHFYRVISLEQEKIELVKQAIFQMGIAFIIPWTLWGLLMASHSDFSKASAQNFLVLFLASLLWNGLGVLCLKRKLNFFLLR